MQTYQINQTLDLIINSSKFSNLSIDQKEILKRKLVQKFRNDFNLTALEMLDINQKTEFSQLLEAGNQIEIENYILENIKDLENLSQKTALKFSQEVRLLLSN